MIMADYRKLKPFILRWEGGFANVKNDRGGATNKGITITTFRAYFGKGKTVDDLKRLTDAQWDYIFLRGFWKPFGADSINSQPIANICVDWAWASGTVTAIRQVQSILKVPVDGKVGPKTIEAINTANSKALFERIKAGRLLFVDNIVKRDPSQRVFIKGWKNRINAIKYE